MHAIAAKVKNGFTATEAYILKVKDVITDTVQAIRNRLSPLPSSTNDEANSESVIYKNNPCHCSYCDESNRLHIQQVCCCPCRACFNGTHAALDFARRTVSCVLNFLCYPFLPCVLVLLPTPCKESAYSNANTLHCCYGGASCLHQQSDEKQPWCRTCVSQQCFCLLCLSVLATAICLILWDFMQDSDFLIPLLLFLNGLHPLTLTFSFVVLFTLVSLPMAWGYVILNLAAGYLYGFVLAIPVVVLSVTIGITIAHILCKKYFSNWVLGLLKNRANFDQIEAIIQVIDGSSGLKVVALTRLTPIPFGFQNGLFAISNVNLKQYLIYSNIGLLPTQVLNCYLGSTVRSMQEIIDEDSPASFSFFIVQIAIGVFLMMFVLRRARRELATALQNSRNQAPLSNHNAETIDQPVDESLIEVKCTQPVSNTSSSTDIQ